MNEEKAKEVATSLIDRQSEIVICTMNEFKEPCQRAMVKIKYEGLKYFYFATNKNSDKVQNIMKNNTGSVYLYDSLNYEGVCINGTFELADPLDYGIDRHYFPEGMKQEDYYAIKLTTSYLSVYKGYDKCIVRI